MSYTAMYGVPVKGEIEEIKEYKNSHFSAPVIWRKLFEEYLKEGEHDFYFQRFEDLWKLIDDKRLEDFEKILLSCTFDNTILKKDNFNKFCKAIDSWVIKYPIERHPSIKEEDFKERDYFHFISIKEDLEQLDYKNYIGVCFNWTSVTNIWYSDREDEEEELFMYDISKDKKHWFLFEYLKGRIINKDK